MTEYQYNVNKNTIEQDGKFIAYLNSFDAYKIIKLLNELVEENQILKAQLFCDIDEGVCSICKHQYLVESGEYYIAKCEKEHSECSKVSLKYCEDFEE